MPLEVDMTDVPNETRVKMHKLLTDENAFALVQAKLRQARIAKFYRENRPRSIDGLGGVEMSVDPYFIGYFNALHRRNVFLDPEFRAWLGKRDEMFRVKAGGTRVQVGYAPTRPNFRKKYGDS